MNGQTQPTTWSLEAITEAVIHILKDMTSEWDMQLDGPIGPKTRLVSELQFESIDVVQFVVAIEERFKRRGMPFEQMLMHDGRYVDEITVEQTAEFLHRHLNG